MGVSNLNDLFVHDLEDIYYAENELLDALDTLANQTDNEEAVDAFQEHRSETEGHIGRLDDVFEMLDKEPELEECEGIEGLIKEHETFVDEEDPERRVLDLHNLVAAQKTEQYEIVAYENLALVAERLGMDEASELLRENLQEEKDALDTLSSLVEEFDYGTVMEQSAD
jgi:ferritin-like metal-binding protein YciE